jgi:hypothetical protein
MYRSLSAIFEIRDFQKWRDFAKSPEEFWRVRRLIEGVEASDSGAATKA